MIGLVAPVTNLEPIENYSSKNVFLKKIFFFQYIFQVGKQSFFLNVYYSMGKRQNNLFFKKEKYE